MEAIFINRLRRKSSAFFVYNLNVIILFAVRRTTELIQIRYLLLSVIHYRNKDGTIALVEYNMSQFMLKMNMPKLIFGVGYGYF